MTGSGQPHNGSPKAPQRRVPLHGAAGIAIIAAAEALLFAGNAWVKMYFTPIAWTGYILLVDAVILRRKGESPIVSRRREFLLLLPISIVSWYLFEGVNLLLKNWTYLDLPESAPARWLGYAWSYATITPAIFLTAELVDSFIGSGLRGRRPIDLSPRTEAAFFWIGFLLFAATLVFPSPYLCPLPWVSVLLWFEGMNDTRRLGSFSAMLRRGDYSLLVSLLVSGALCGLLWEFWNFWAATKWHYDVPYLGSVRLFEMPVLGFLGFPPFALECFLLYRFIRWLVPRPLDADVLGLGWSAAARGGGE